MQQSSNLSCSLPLWAPCWLQVSLSVLDPKLWLFLWPTWNSKISLKADYGSALSSQIAALTVSASSDDLRCTVSNPQAAHAVDTVQYLLVGLDWVDWHIRHLQVPEDHMQQHCFSFLGFNCEMLMTPSAISCRMNGWNTIYLDFPQNPQWLCVFAGERWLQMCHI